MVEKIVLLLLAFVVSSASATDSFEENELLEQSESQSLIISPRIIGGVSADINEFKFYARLVTTDFSSYYSHLCGGTLINQQFVLTAAHCLEMTGIAKEDLAIVVNNANFAGVQANELRPVENIYIHPEYNPYGYVNDIAIIKLASKIIDDVEFISLPSDDDKLYYEQLATMSVTGLGYTDTLGSSPDHLLTTEVTLLSDSDCESRVSYYFRQDFIYNNAMCVIPTNFNGSCSGDSGGPLTYVDFDGKNKQVGLVSYGAKECVLSGVPTVYSELHGYKEWIEANSQITADELPDINLTNNEIISSNGGAASYYFLFILFGSMITRRKLLKK